MKQGLLKGRSAYWIAIFVLLLVLPLSVLAAVTFGTMDLSIAAVYRSILQGPLPPAGLQDPIYNVVWLIRLPRLILAIAVGMGLSICGLVMQAVVKNPLADPYILGVSSGASLGATLAIMMGVGASLGSNFLGLMGFAGAFVSSLAVMALANIGGRSSAVKLLLSGTAVSAVCSAFSNLIVFLSNKKEATTQIVHWTMGSLAGAEWRSNGVIFCVILAGTLFFWSQSRTMNLMLLGDESAITLGTDLHRWRILCLLVSALMMGFAVYSAGMIGFVGLVIPHIVRMLFGTDHKKLIPISALLGAVFLVWADVLCRIVVPGTEMPIGILTSMTGAPVFLYLMARKKYGFGGGT